MKKLYTLLSVIAFAFSVNAQTPIITGIMDGDCTGGNPKVLEIYASGTVDFTLYSLQNQTNAGTTWTAVPVSLSSLGTVTNAFVYVVSTDAALTVFTTEFPSLMPATTLVNNIVNMNGNDRIRIINSTTMDVIDQFGVTDTNGETTEWETTDSWAKRVNGTGPDAGFVISNWTFGGVANLDLQGLCQGGTIYESLVPFGEFTLSAPSFNAISGLKVYPNPVVDGKLYINTDANSSKEVVIYDVLGKQVLKATTNNAVNVSNLNGGVYIVKITEEGKTATRKLVIK